MKTDSSDREFKNLLEERENNYYLFNRYACYWRYKSEYTKRNIYFGHLLPDVPGFTKRLLKEFELFFPKIKIKVMYSGFYYTYIDKTGDYHTRTRVISKTKPNEPYTFNEAIIYRLSYSREYSKYSKYILNVPLAQLIRMYDPQYRFVKDLSINNDYSGIPLIKNLIKKNYSGYGVWARNVNLKTLKLVNNTEFLNLPEVQTFFKSINDQMPYGTNIFKRLKLLAKKQGVL